MFFQRSLPARRYASAGTIAVALCLCLRLSACLCLSVTSRFSIETADRIGLVLAWELSSTDPTCVGRKFRYLQK